VLCCEVCCLAVWQFVAAHAAERLGVTGVYVLVRCSVVQCGTVWCSVVQCCAVSCCVLQCVAVCCSALQCVAVGGSVGCCGTRH